MCTNTYWVGLYVGLGESSCDYCRISFFRYDVTDLPTEDQDLKDWLSNIWKGKEHILHRFYSSGSFTNQDFTPDCLEQNNTNELLKKRAMAENFDDCHCGKYISNNKEATFLVNNKRNIPEEHEKQKIINNVRNNKNEKNSPGNNLYLALIFWTILVLAFFYILFTNFYFQIWVSFHFILFFSLSFVSQGFHQLLAWYNRNSDREKMLKKCEWEW